MQDVQVNKGWNGADQEITEKNVQAETTMKTPWRAYEVHTIYWANEEVWLRCLVP